MVREIDESIAISMGLVWRKGEDMSMSMSRWGRSY